MKDTPQFKPMLAVDADLNKLKFPVIVSPKLDGIRCFIRDGVALTRSLKPIPNRYIQDQLQRPEFEGLDGELIVGPPTASDCYLTTVSGVMSRGGEPEFMFHVFDHLGCLEAPFHVRMDMVNNHIRCTLMKGLMAGQHYPMRMVEHRAVTNTEELLAAEELHLNEGYEGVMLRDPLGPYKCGRATVKEGWLLKLKRFSDSDFVVTAVEEQMTNTNEAVKNALGRTERSTAREGLVPAGTLGRFLGYDVHTKQEITVAPGCLTHPERKALWDARESLVGRLAKYKFFKVGNYDKPRFPSFLGWRDEKDMGNE